MVAAGLDRDEALDVGQQARWRHDVIRRQAVEFERISDDARDPWHGREHCRLEFRSAARDEDLCVGAAVDVRGGLPAGSGGRLRWSPRSC